MFENLDYIPDGQLDIFDYIRKPFKIDKPIRLIELFGGIGSQAMALRNIGANFEHHLLVEWEDAPVRLYNAIHGTDFKPTDIQKIHGEDLNISDTDKYCYICTYSFPCQDLSVAGKMRGYSKGESTRSGLLWEVERLLRELVERERELPQVLVMENVIQVHSPGENMENFQKWIDFLTSIGYSSYWQNMEASQYGTPQHRDRTIMVSILGEYQYKFPKPQKLEKYVDEYLEEGQVDEKYYLNNDKTDILLDKLEDKGIILTDRQTDRQTIESLWTSQSTIQNGTESQTVSVQDMTRESDTEDQTAVVCVRGFRGTKIEFEARQTKVAHCILAQKGKCTSNLGEDFVICKKKQY